MKTENIKKNLIKYIYFIIHKYLLMEVNKFQLKIEINKTKYAEKEFEVKALEIIIKTVNESFSDTIKNDIKFQEFRKIVIAWSMKILFNEYFYIKNAKILFKILFSEEEQCHFYDLLEVWTKECANHYQVWWKIVDHLILQKFVIAPVSRLWDTCSRTVRGILGA